MRNNDAAIANKDLGQFAKESFKSLLHSNWFINGKEHLINLKIYKGILKFNIIRVEIMSGYNRTNELGRVGNKF